VADVRRALKVGDTSGHKPDVAELFDIWLPLQTHLRRATYISYEGHINNYIKPKIGDILLDRLSVKNLTQMFTDIAADSEAAAKNNEDRMAIKAQIAAAPTSPRSIRRALREELANLPPYRRPIGPAGRMSIKRTLRVALNYAVGEQLISFNPAQHTKLVYTKPRVLVWTDARVAKWRRTGIKPSSVMVWTPEQAAAFLDFTAEDEFAAFWRVKMFRGPRRGEMCGLGWTEVDENYRWMQITTQLTEVDYEIEEGPPKTAAGFRIVALDERSGQALRAHRLAQNKARLQWGGAWVESGLVFTEANGAPLRPSKMTDRFESLVAASGLPPIRLHDLRHQAAVLALAAGTDMKVIQDMLGHASLSVTSDLYTTVLPELALSAAEASADLVDKARRRPPGHALATQPPKRS
jgi:integrase